LLKNEGSKDKLKSTHAKWTTGRYGAKDLNSLKSVIFQKNSVFLDTFA
jgi:hypothetical protein